jgi:hypothetical protein
MQCTLCANTQPRYSRERAVHHIKRRVETFREATTETTHFILGQVVSETTSASLACRTNCNGAHHRAFADGGQKPRLVKVSSGDSICHGNFLTTHRSDLSARTETTRNDSSVTTQATSAIARGSFAVPIQLPQQQSSACLARTNESVAWQCASDTTFQFNILPPPMDSNTTMITLGSMPDMNGTIYHGHQAPNVLPTELRLITGADSPERDGPVYHFRSTYDRIVLLKDSDLLYIDQPQSQPVMRSPIFRNGEWLWRCTFNESMIEGYIYPSQKTAMASSFNSTTMTVKDLPKMPYVLKLVEQRMPNGKGPYCEKMKVQDGKLARLSGEKVLLKLMEPEAEAEAAARIRSARFRARQQEKESSYCRCQWMVQ